MPKNLFKLKIPMLISFILSTLYLPSVNADMLKLRDNKEDINQEIIKIEKGKVFLKNNQILRLNQVKEISFPKMQEQTKAVPANATKEELAKIQDLFKSADEYSLKYPGIDGLILLDDGEYIFNPDGTYKMTTHFIGQVKKDSAKRDFSSVVKAFTNGRSSVKIIKASVYHRDGKIFNMNPKDVKITPPQGDALFFVNYNTLNYSMPQVEVDSVVEWIMEESSYNPFRKDFVYPVWYFQGFQPTKNCSFKITMPKGKEIYYSTKNMTDKLKVPQITEDKDTKTYTWATENSPPVIAEPNMPNFQDVVPAIKASVINDWSTVTSWLKKMHQERINAGPELKKFTLNLVKDAKTPEEKIAKIYHYIQQKIRYVAIKMDEGASTFGGWDANQTWKKQFGCCIDKALLFSAMLKVVGIDSGTILLNTNTGPDAVFDVPDFYLEHAITVINLNGKKMFLDSTGSDFRYPYFASVDQGVQCINIFDEKIDEIPLSPPEDTAQRLNFAINLDPKGNADVSTSSEYTGEYEAGVRGFYKSIKEEERMKQLQEMINAISPGALLSSYKFHNIEDISKPFWFNMDYKLFDYPVKAADLLVFQIPFFKKSYGEISLEDRKYPIEYNYALDDTVTYNINLPDNMEIKYMPPDIDLKNIYASYKATSQIKGRTISFNTSFKRHTRLVPAADYKMYKEFLNKISRYTEDRLFLKVAK